jgi:hypothetical protein
VEEVEDVVAGVDELRDAEDVYRTAEDLAKERTASTAMYALPEELQIQQALIDTAPPPPPRRSLGEMPSSGGGGGRAAAAAVGVSNDDAYADPADIMHGARVTAGLWLLEKRALGIYTCC